MERRHRMVAALSEMAPDRVGSRAAERLGIDGRKPAAVIGMLVEQEHRDLA
jgi:hypothetical protein